MEISREQHALDEIHRLSKALQALCDEDASKLIRRMACGAMIELQQITDRLFCCPSLAEEIIKVDLSSVNSIILKLSRSSSSSSSTKVGGGSYSTIDCLIERLLIDELVQSGKVIRENGDKLIEILTRVRSFEREFSFQRRLFFDKSVIKLQLDCDLEQLTYGSSSLSLWSSLASLPSVVRAARPGKRACVVVIFGASQGLLAFYSSCLFPPCKVVGYEVLPSLHEASVQLATQFDMREFSFCAHILNIYFISSVLLLSSFFIYFSNLRA